MRHVIGCAAVLGMLGLPPGAMPAAEAAEAPEQMVRSFADQGLALLAAGDLSKRERRRAVRRLFDSHFDLAITGRFVLGKHWRRASAAERQDYLQLFHDYVVLRTLRLLEGYAGETIRVGRATPKGKKAAIVASVILRPGSEPIRVDWRLLSGPEGWRIVDVAVEGVSLALTQRSEFDSVIRLDGGRIDGLLHRLREQTASLGAAAS